LLLPGVTCELRQVDDSYLYCCLDYGVVQNGLIAMYLVLLVSTLTIHGMLLVWYYLAFFILTMFSSI
jgi:hypothetical protein